jgi:hypothetical protein
MKFKKIGMVVLLSLFLTPFLSSGQQIDVSKLKNIRLKQYPVKGLMWKGESALNTNWNKITETPDGKIWFCGGDHWGSDEITGPWDKSDRYERPWGFGNTAVVYYDPKTDKVEEAIELDKASSIYSNAETPGHGKIHGNITCDSKGNVYFAGYMGLSYMHEFDNSYYPKSYAGGTVCKYDPVTKNVTNLGIPLPYGATVGLYYDEKRNSLCGITPDRAKFWRIKVGTMELNRYESLARMSRLEDRVREMIMDKEGYCYFANDIGGLTKYDPDKETFTDLDVKLPGKLMDFRSTVVSSKNIIYAITTDGLIWSFDPKTNKLEDLGHIFGMPEQGCYTPNIALDEEWGRLYFIANNHGGKVLETALVTLTIIDIKTKQHYYVGKVEGVEGCFGSKCTKEHTVYFSSFGHHLDGDTVEKDSKGKVVTRPYLIRYDPPKDLTSLKE